MTFADFIEQTDYSPTHVAHSLLYKPNSRPSKLAQTLGYSPSVDDMKNMRKLIAGKGDHSELFKQAS